MRYLIDVQGTLISDADKAPINGAIELIEFFNSQNIPYVVITNNTKFKSDEFLASLTAQGIMIKDGSYLDPFCVLSEVLPPCDVAMFGSDEFMRTMIRLGYRQNLATPKAVLVASFDNFKFKEFALMVEFVQNGAKFIPLHETSIYKKLGRAYPGVGAIASMISYATGCTYEVVGKPSVNFYKEALRLLNLQVATNFEDIFVLSDDAKGDLVGAKKLGMKTGLVLSGKVDSVDKAGVDRRDIDKIYTDVGEFLGEISAKY